MLDRTDNLNDLMQKFDTATTAQVAVSIAHQNLVQKRSLEKDFQKNKKVRIAQCF